MTSNSLRKGHFLRLNVTGLEKKGQGKVNPLFTLHCIAFKFCILTQNRSKKTGVDYLLCELSALDLSQKNPIQGQITHIVTPSQI
jgi:hypothetical protein